MKNEGRKKNKQNEKHECVAKSKWKEKQHEYTDILFLQNKKKK